MKRFFLILLLLAGTFSGIHANAQTIDSIARLDTNTSPGHIYVRLKFPHQGFIYKRTMGGYPNILPPTGIVVFYFKECRNTGNSFYYEDTLDLWISPPSIYYKYTYFYFRLILDTNTIDTNCAYRSAFSLVDSTHRLYPEESVGVSVAEMENISLYPNPVTGSQLHLDLKGAILKPEKIQLYSLEGRKIEISYLAGSSTIRLPENLASGTYFLLLTFSDGQQLRRKITVQ